MSRAPYQSLRIGISRQRMRALRPASGEGSPDLRTAQRTVVVVRRDGEPSPSVAQSATGCLALSLMFDTDPLPAVGPRLREPAACRELDLNERRGNLPA